MTDKEKEAIKTMQHWIDYEKANKEKINKADELIEIQETVLNLIQTQQEEKEKLKSVEKKGDITANCNVELIEELRGEIKKKDRVIDLTIRELYKKAHISTKCYLQTSIEECLEHKNCIECLKQYFERKVQNDN